MATMERIVDEQRGVETHHRRHTTKLKLKNIDRAFPDPDQYAEMREAMGYNLPVKRLGDGDAVEERYRNDNGDWDAYLAIQKRLGKIPLPKKEFLAGAFNVSLTDDDNIETETSVTETDGSTPSATPAPAPAPQPTAPTALNRHMVLRQFCGIVERECRNPELVVMWHAQMTARHIFAGTEEQFRQLWEQFRSQSS